MDTSVIVAIVLRQSMERWCLETVAGFPQETLRMSWVNIAEAGMSLNRENPNALAALEPLLTQSGVERLHLDAATVHIAVEARSRFPLNFGDCFAYAHSKIRREALITLDNDFLKTDLAGLIHPARG